ncbi:IS66 family insertion sequence element accessory protein TnpB [uncultured Oscillibacter sp.]|uniref:IS66 family insertion sequence element accessory protein TnpB n=1 Tax=uncultured Oscillibacter sp. TaxID=876091 RepID=UPI002631B68A|nr:IS66 family insertion sequence element accessory protein TnpB [uncultured Oscillibacter sp.]
MYTGLDGLLGIIRYQLNHSPYDGNLYVFRDLSGTMIKYLEWDGAGFCLSKRRGRKSSARRTKK